MKSLFSLRKLFLLGLFASSAVMAPGVFAAEKTLAICVPQYAEFFKFVADTVKAPMEKLGYKVEIASADLDPQTMINQIQNFTTRRPELMYVFPAGDPGSFNDVVKKAKEAGIKVVVSHVPTAAGTATSLVTADEFLMGAMGSRMVSQWVDQTYPNAAPGSVKLLVLEANMIPDIIKRCVGLKLIAEPLLRKVDMKTAGYVQGDAGLIKDAAGKAIPNPFYNAKVKLVQIADKRIITNAEAQTALDLAFTANTGANKDIAAVISYSGDAAIGANEKIVQMSLDKTLKTPLNKMGVFGADLTPTNIKAMSAAKNGTSVLRGVMTNGNIIGTVVKLLTALSKGEKVPEYAEEPLGFVVPTADYASTVETLYKNELPSSAKFF